MSIDAALQAKNEGFQKPAVIFQQQLAAARAGVAVECRVQECCLCVATKTTL